MKGKKNKLGTNQEFQKYMQRMHGFVNEQIGHCPHSSLIQEKDKSQKGQEWILRQTSSGRTDSQVSRDGDGPGDEA